MRMIKLAAPLTAIALLLLTASPAMGAEPTKLKLAESPYGDVIFADGYAMYLFTKDEGKRSRCYRACAKAWPPLEAKGQVVAGSGIDQALIGNTKRRDGTRQITYAGKPLYGYVHDPRWEVYCNDVFEYGGDWFAVSADGSAP